MAGYFNGSQYAEITDDSALTMNASNGWTFTFFLYPDTSITNNDNGYFYSHGTVFGTNPAIQIIRLGPLSGIGPVNTIRVILDWAGGNLVDFVSTETLVSDVWNRVIVTYIAGGNLIIAINGVADTHLPPSLPDINPAGNARIGYATIGGSRNFAGRIAHAAQYDRNFTQTDVTAFSGTYLSPEFAQRDLSWHSPMFSGAVWDRQNNVVITPQGGMSWQPHGPFIYPAKSFNGQGSGGFAPGGEDSWRNFRAA